MYCLFIGHTNMDGKFIVETKRRVKHFRTGISFLKLFQRAAGKYNASAVGNGVFE